MTELETMQRAKMYLDKLAQGIDPITNQALPEDSALNQVRLARCFFFVSDILGRVITNGGQIGPSGKNLDFMILPDQLARVQIMDRPVRITEFTDALWQAVGNPQMKKPSAKKITDWLIDRGFMTQVREQEGKFRRIPTEYGLGMGMSTRWSQSRNGEYQAVYYDQNMQRFLLDHVLAIFEAK